MNEEIIFQEGLQDEEMENISEIEKDSELYSDPEVWDVQEKEMHGDYRGAYRKCLDMINKKKEVDTKERHHETRAHYTKMDINKENTDYAKGGMKHAFYKSLKTRIGVTTSLFFAFLGFLMCLVALVGMYNLFFYLILILLVFLVKHFNKHKIGKWESIIRLHYTPQVTNEKIFDVLSNTYSEYLLSKQSEGYCLLKKGRRKLISVVSSHDEKDSTIKIVQHGLMKAELRNSVTDTIIKSIPNMIDDNYNNEILTSDFDSSEADEKNEIAFVIAIGSALIPLLLWAFL